MTDRYTLWYSHDKVYKAAWQPLIRHLTGEAATLELTTRQDRTRRRQEPITFKVLPDGQTP